MKEPAIIKVCSIQIELYRYDRVRNLEKSISMTESCAKNHCPHLILLPNYIMQTGLDPIPGAVTDEILRIADKFDVCIAGGLAEKISENAGYNSVFLAVPGHKVVRFQSKLHLINMEKKKLIPGEPVYNVIDLCGAKVGCVLCNDILFPEIARIMAIKGSEILLVPSSMAGYAVPVLDIFCRARALENMAYLINANVIPADLKEKYPDMVFGGSGIYSPFQSRMVFAKAGNSDEVITAIIDLEELREKRAKEKKQPANLEELMTGDGANMLYDRRPEIYEPLIHRRE